jgi:hypothetical protein
VLSGLPDEEGFVSIAEADDYARRIIQLINLARRVDPKGHVESLTQFGFSDDELNDLIVPFVTYFYKPFLDICLDDGFDVEDLTEAKLRSIVLPAPKGPGVYLKGHFDQDGRLVGVYVGESLEISKRFKAKAPDSLHNLGDIIAGAITRGDDLEKRATCALEGVAALIVYRANLGRTQFESMQFPSHNSVRCGSHDWMAPKEDLRLALKAAKSQGTAVPRALQHQHDRQQAGAIRKARETREKAKFFARFTSEMGLMHFINGGVYFLRHDGTWTTFSTRDVKYVFEHKSYRNELKDKRFWDDCYFLVIEEFLILKGVNIQPSSSKEDAQKKNAATRTRAVTPWVRPPKTTVESIDRMFRKEVDRAKEGTKRIPFTPALTRLIGAPGLIDVRNNGWGCIIFADGGIRRFSSRNLHRMLSFFSSSSHN